MSIRLALAAASAIAFASPAIAQDTTQTPPPAEQQRPLTAEEQAFQAQNEAFGQMMDGLVTEIQTLFNDPATTGEQKQAAANSLIDARTPDINAFADTIQAFFTTQRGLTTDPAQQAEIDRIIAEGPAQVRQIPEVLRARVAQSIEQAAAAAAAGVAPTQPPATGGAVAGTPPQGAVAGTPPQQ